jgi:hypothetical protein
MGAVRPYEKAKLVVGGLSKFPEAWAAARRRLLALHGPVDLEAGPWPFAFTGYYREEMGEPLQRWFVAFERLVGQDELAAIKHGTNLIEEQTASPEWPVRRAVNLDPGLLTLGKLMLATTKDQAHRVPIGGDMFAEVTLHYAGRRYVPNDWTYADYRQEAYLDFFAKVREKLHAQLRG